MGPLISFIIPTYNEENVIQQTLEKVIVHIKQFDYEVIIADDGSTDNTYPIIQSFAKKNKHIYGFSLSPNQGRGAVLTAALQKAKGKYAIYFDADLQLDLSLIEPVFSKLKEGADIAIVSKYHPSCKGNYSLFRSFFGRSYACLARFVLGCPFSDFQGGFKGFNIQTILPILGSVKQKKWNWDTEILAKSYWAGLHIEEVPGILNKSNKRQSKVAVFHEIFIMANGLYEIWKDKKIK